eukprot:gene22226-29291_t
MDAAAPSPDAPALEQCNSPTLALLGGAGSGKSSLIGHLLYRLGAVGARTMEGHERDAMDAGNLNAKFSMVVNNCAVERTGNFSTVTVHTAKLQTKNQLRTVIDVPGCRKYMKSAVRGASMADCAILVLDARNPLESGADSSYQAREHILLAKALGIRQIVVVVTQMDCVDYEEKYFEDARLKASPWLKKCGFQPELNTVISQPPPSPIPTIRYHGSLLIEALDNLSITKPAPVPSKPLRMTVQRSLSSDGARHGYVVARRDRRVKSIEVHRQTVDEAKEGDYAGVSLRGVGLQDLDDGAQVLCDSEEGTARQVTKFVAQISVQRPKGIRVGYFPMVDVHVAHVACRFSRMISKLDKKTGGVATDEPSQLMGGDVGVVELEPLKPLCVEPHTVCSQLSRFVATDLDGVIVAFGRILSVETEAVSKRPGSLLVSCQQGSSTARGA